MPNRLRTDLGTAHQWSNDPKVRPGHLTLRELDELVRRAGMTAGLVPRSEFPVTIQGGKLPKRLDWVWMKSPKDHRVVATFEIDGLSVDGPNADKALLTNQIIAAPLRYLLLFQIDHDFSWKGHKGRVANGLSTEVEARKLRFRAAGVTVRRDEELSSGYIHQIVADARAASARMP